MVKKVTDKTKTKTSKTSKRIKQLATENYTSTENNDDPVPMKDIVKTVHKNLFKAMTFKNKVLYVVTYIVNKIKNLLVGK